MVLLASDFNKSRFLKAEDIDGEKKFRIKDVIPEKIGDDKEEKLVVWFTNDKRGLVLNQTNLRVLRAAFGDPVKDWIGKIIVIFTMLVDNRGKMTPGLRVRIPPPKQSAATAEPPQQPAKSSNRAAAPTSGNGAATAPPVAAAPPAAPAAVHDPELEPDPVKPIKEELEDEIPW
jgi:hypothetical protein